MVHAIMKTLPLILALVVLGISAEAASRKWTSADDASKSFDGELTAVKGDSAVIRMKNGRSVTLPLAKLSKEDQDFIAAEEKAKADATAAAEAADKAKNGEVAKALAGSTVKLDGKRLKKHDIFAEKAPEYYLVYWGASWCGPCRAAAPALAEAYDHTIAKAKNVEVVHLSCDQDEADMISFMKDMKFNFSAVPGDKWRKDKLFSSMAPRGIPNYKLLDASGKIIAEGEEAKAKAKQLSAGSGGETAAAE
jgi:nucleoredoxin